MRVLHVAESFGGGVATAMAEYVRSTPDVEHHLLYGERSQVTPDSFDPYVSSKPLGRGLAPIRAIRSAVDQLHPDVVHAQSSFAGAYVRLALSNRRVRIVYTPHCFAFMRRDIGGASRLGYRLLERVLALNTEVLAGCSPFEAETGRRWRGAEHAVHVPNIARVGDGRGSAAGSDTPDGPVVGLGRLDAQKDPDWFAGVVALLPTTVEPVWIGGGSAEAQARMERSGTRVTGWLSREAAMAELSSAGCFVSSALWEGFPMVLLEASALGVPVVLRRLEALPDSPGEATVDSPAEARDLVRRIMEDPRERERNLKVWRAYLSDHTPARQREALLHAYGA